MSQFTGWQWLLIDAANQYGKDKLLFEERIQWAEDNLSNLEALAAQADSKTKPLYLKAVKAIRKAQKGLPTGHMVGVDASCSGMQIMSALTGCLAGADATGLVDPNRRADAYTTMTNTMNTILGGGLTVSRADAKRATMTAYYGSKATPKELFGEGTRELGAFYEAATTVAPGAWDLLQVLIASWQSGALVHSWKLPDGFDARVKVMAKREVRIEVDELNHASFTYQFYENAGQKKGLSNAANMVHSMDAYVLREMHRRCNYDREVMAYADACIQAELIHYTLNPKRMPDKATHKVAYYVEQYQRSSLASAVILPWLNEDTVKMLTKEHLQALASITQAMLSHKPFQLVTVHDEFKAHPNNINQVCQHYREILAEIADSNVLDDLLSQLHGVLGQYPKLSSNLGDKIRKSRYALC